VVISAAVGAGHDTAARELARRLTARGFQVDHLDLLEQFPCRLGNLINVAYQGMVTRLPWSYQALFSVTDRFAVSAPLVRALLRPMRRRLRRLIPPDTRAVVSTYPFASQVLGPLRRSGRLPAPVITYVTDFSVHPTWVCPGVDVHCAVHPLTGARARELGAADVRVVDPLVADGFRPASDAAKRNARQHFGLPLEGRLALLVAGSWGLGEVAAAAAEIAATRAAEPVVVCGRNEDLHRRLRRQQGHVLGWVDDMAALMRAADVVVENGGGMTAREAMVSGLPVASYRPIPGHGRASAAMMAGAGVAAWIRRPDALATTLADLIDGPGGRRLRAAGLALSDANAATVVTEAAARPPVEHPAGRVRRTASMAITAAVTVAAALGRRPPTPAPAPNHAGRRGGGAVARHRVPRPLIR
jgi:UDP-N-acetylglucosamine:LPS N-acetylglucosamine transferase